MLKCSGLIYQTNVNHILSVIPSEARNLCHIVFKSIMSDNYYYKDSSLHFVPFRMTPYAFLELLCSGLIYQTNVNHILSVIPSSARNLCHIVFKSIMSDNYYYKDSSLHYVPFRMTHYAFLELLCSGLIYQTNVRTHIE